MVCPHISSLFVAREPLVLWRQGRRCKMTADILCCMSRAFCEADTVCRALVALTAEGLVKYAG